MSLSRTFQDQPEKENGYPREQKQLHAVIRDFKIRDATAVRRDRK